MKSISTFLDKFKSLERPDRKKELSIKFIFIETGILLKKNELDFRGKTLFIKASGAVKNEIYLRKELLLKKIAESITAFKIEDIR